MAVFNLLDIAKANGNDATVGLIDETTKAHPELTLVAARTIMGLNYRTLVRTGLPTVAFRNANEGSVPSKATHENRLVETFIASPRWSADKAVADRYEDGAAAFMALEAAAQVEAAMQLVAKQFYYGTTSGVGDAKGHPGLVQMYDATNMAVDAGGTTASTGSSAWLIKSGPRDVQWVWGNNGDLAPGDVDIRDVLDGSSNPYEAYVQTMNFYPGLALHSLRSAVRIKKLTEDSGKGLTDDLIAKALEKFEVGIVPDMILVTRRSLRQLRASRTATNPTGAPAPIPTESFNIPIQVTDAILNTESLTL